MESIGSAIRTPNFVSVASFGHKRSWSASVAGGKNYPSALESVTIFSGILIDVGAFC